MAIYLNGQLVAGGLDSLNNAFVLYTGDLDKATANKEKIYVKKIYNESDILNLLFVAYNEKKNKWYKYSFGMSTEVSE